MTKAVMIALTVIAIPLKTNTHSLAEAEKSNAAQKLKEILDILSLDGPNKNLLYCRNAIPYLIDCCDFYIPILRKEEE